jgi:hypothetical protein
MTSTRMRTMKPPGAAAKGLVAGLVGIMPRL